MALAKEFYILFFEETKKDLRAVEVHAKNAEWSDVSLLAHRIRGRSRIMSFAEFEELCTEVERSASVGGQTDIDSKIAAVHAAFEARRKKELG